MAPGGLDDVDFAVFFRKLRRGAAEVLQRGGGRRRRAPLVVQSQGARPQRRVALSRHGALRRGRRNQHAGADRRYARRRGPLRLGRRDRLAAKRRAGQAAQGHRRAPDPRHQSLRLRLDPPRDRGQCRPQPQLRRSRQGLSEERRLPRHRRRHPAQGVERGQHGRDDARVRRLHPEARCVRPARRHQRRPVQPSRRHLLRRQHADLEQPHDSRHRPRGALARRGVSASSTSIPDWDRSAMAS